MGNSANRLLLVLVFVLTIVCTATITFLAVKGEAPEPKTQIGAGVSAEDVAEIVEKFITENPNVIIQAFQQAKQRQAVREREVAEKEIKVREKDINHDPKTPFTGNPDGDVTIVKFSDYNCGFCKRVVPDLLTILKEDKNVKFVMKDFPILGPRSTANSKAALAVNKMAPEKWWDFHLAMLKSAPRTDDQLLALAEKVGVDSAKLKVEMAKAEHAKQITKNLSLGQSIGVRGTPAFVINGEFIRGAVSLDIFKERIAAARARK